ncbi:MAG: hypothetical protein AUI33_14930, partial [Ignavibacteria bacterium 13_1_40CM_2_61_4]
NPRALHRRAKVLPAGSLIDDQDLPLWRPYLQTVQGLGGFLVHESRWLNAASFSLTPGMIVAVSHLGFVKSVEPVVAYRRRSRLAGQAGSSEGDPAPPPPSRPSRFGGQAGIDYGQSATQLQVINVPQLHDLGITGCGVLVGMLDSGFRWRVHETLRTRRVIAEHDFVFNDDTTSNQGLADAGQDLHGSLTMSVLGGYMPGRLVGPAFDAEFILGKTEDVHSETPVEEDNWAAGIEWMEGHGADLVSSSLGYNIFDGGSGYLWSRGDFNGKTSVTAMAAARAARLGVVVCDAMGNEGNGDGSMGTMLTPADADSIISVGAVTFSKRLAYFSSTGPTNDGRTKPDIVTPGVSVYCAIVPNSYGIQQGTSLATPLAAGSAALVLSVRPELSPAQVRDAMRATAEPITDTARFPLSPNNFTGWGLVNAFEAALSFGPVFSNVPGITVSDSGSSVSTGIASRYGIRPDGVVLHYFAGGNGGYSAISMSFDSAMFYPTSGRYRAAIPRQPYATLVQFYIDASDSGGHSYRSPAASTGTVWHLRYGETGGGRNPSIPGAFALAQNYPNPFNNETVIEYDLPADEFVDLRIFDLTGREVEVLVHGSQKAGYGHSVGFHAGSLASGVYFYRMTAPAFTATKKMMVLR